MPSLRFADPQTLTQYPLEISSTADWQPEQSAPGAADDVELLAVLRGSRPAAER